VGILRGRVGLDAFTLLATGGYTGQQGDHQSGKTGFHSSIVATAVKSVKQPCIFRTGAKGSGSTMAELKN